MVIPLGPGKFYGSSLPRPRYYTDVKLNADRVDPPVPVLDPLLSWANDAHWSMGGLSFKRLRLQGRIEGSVERLRKQREKLVTVQSPIVKADPDLGQTNKKGDKNKKRAARPGSASPPPAPMATKRRRRMVLAASSGEDVEEEETVVEREKGRVARKLVGEFDKVARMGVGDDVMKIVEELNVNESVEEKSVKSGSRSSPRLAKRKLG